MLTMHTQYVKPLGMVTLIGPWATIASDSECELPESSCIHRSQILHSGVDCFALKDADHCWALSAAGYVAGVQQANEEWLLCCGSSWNIVRLNAA